jgi:hypothetical protein
MGNNAREIKRCAICGTGINKTTNIHQNKRKGNADMQYKSATEKSNIMCIGKTERS